MKDQNVSKITHTCTITFLHKQLIATLDIKLWNVLLITNLIHTDLMYFNVLTCPIYLKLRKVVHPELEQVRPCPQKLDQVMWPQFGPKSVQMN